MAAIALPPQTAVPKKLSEQDAQSEGEGYADGRIQKPRSSGVNDLLKIHAEAQADDCGLQKKLREGAALDVEMMHGGEAKEKPGSQGYRRRDETARRKDDADIEEVPYHSPLRMSETARGVELFRPSEAR